MKSVLISTRPKWCEKICHEIGTDKNGKPIYEKSIEVRKSVPKCEVPFKAYIYKTKKKKWLDICHVGEVNWIGVTADKTRILKGVEKYGGKVIGEFVCDKVEEYTFSHYEAEYRVTHVEQKVMCLNQPELIRYGKGKTLYGWHITDLKIYDKPKELSEFYTIDESGNDCCIACVYHETPIKEMPCRTCTGERRYLYRPPQSWCYVEELEDDNDK